MKAFGATLDLVHSAPGKITGGLIPSMVQPAKEVAEKPGFYFTSQFQNHDAPVGYEGIGREIVQQIPDGIDAFCGAVGGAGRVMGSSKILKSQWPKTHVVVFESASSPREPTAWSALGSGGFPPHLDSSLYDETRSVPEDESRKMCRRLARDEGLLVGTSTGMNVSAAAELAKKLGPGKKVVTVACDTGLKYMNSSFLADS